jgi:hypothetical protein
MRRRKLFAGTAALAIVAVMAMPLFVPRFTAADAIQGEPLAAHRPTRGAQDVHAELRAIDHALQAAYDRGASDAEIAPMWVARETLLAGLQSTRAESRRDRT